MIADVDSLLSRANSRQVGLDEGYFKDAWIDRVDSIIEFKFFLMQNSHAKANIFIELNAS